MSGVRWKWLQGIPGGWNSLPLPEFISGFSFTTVRTVLWWWYVLGLENPSSRDITLCRIDGWVQPRKRLHGWENACPRVGAWDWDELKQKTSEAREHSMFFLFFFFFFLRYRAILCWKENKDSELSLFSNFLLELRVGGKTRGASFDFLNMHFV